MPYINVGKENTAPIDIYYEDHGAGRPVVLIHGFPLSGTAWEKELPALLKAGYRAITYDRRGFGNSSQPTFGYDYDTFAADLNALMTQLDLHDVTLVGHSMGTGEVTRYIGTYGTDRVKQAVLISPIPPFLLKTADNAEGVDGSVFDGIIQSIAKDRFAYLTEFFKGFYNLKNDLVSDEVVQANFNLAASASGIATAACVPTWLTDFRQDLPKMTVPALIIQGDEDNILPLDVTGKRLNEAVKGSQLHVIKGGSHGIPWTHGDEINSVLLDFMKQ